MAKRNYMGCLFLLGCWLALPGTTFANSYNWLNTATDWGTGANWSPVGVPGSNDTVNLLNITPTNQPTVTGNQAVSNLYINGQNPTPLWNIGGSGTLTCNGGLIELVAGGNAVISCNVALNGNNFMEGPYSQPGTLWLTGALTGTGPLINAMEPGWSGYWGYLVYSNNTSPTFTGGTIANNQGTPCWYLTGNTSTNTFGLDASGQNPGTITLNGGGFGFVGSTTAGTVQQLTLNNPISVTSAGGWLFGVELNTNAQTVFSGPLALGGFLTVGDQMGASYLRASSVASSPTVSFGNPISLQRYARAVCQPNGYGRPVILSGKNSDQYPAAPTPWLLSAVAGVNILTITNAVGITNNYSGGTVIDYCGIDGRSGDSYDSYVVASAGSVLGTGPLTLLPGARLQLSSAGNVATDATVSVNANSLASSALALTFNGVPANLTNSSGAVLAINTPGSFTAIADESAVGNGMMFLGTTLSSATLAPAGGTLLPGKGNVYRLGGGGAYNGVTYGNSGTLTVNATLGDFGNTALQVGQITHQGYGSVSLSTNINTFAGPTDIWMPALWFGGAGCYLAWNQPAYDWLYGIAQQSPTVGSPFGYTNGVVNLHGAGIQLQQQVVNFTTSSTAVVKGHLTFEGTSIVDVKAPNDLTPFMLGIDASSRTNGGFLDVLAANGLYWGNERIILAGSGNPPGYANGIAAPYIIANNDFATYDTTLSNGYARGFAPYSSYVVLPPGGGSGTEVVRQAALALTNNYNIYALKTTGALTSDGVTNRTITVGSGGVILGGNIGASGNGYQVNLNFGAAEGLILQNGLNPYIYGVISGSGGITVNTFISNNGQVFILNTNNNFTGTITLNPPATSFVLDSATGIGSLGAASNGIYFNSGMLSVSGGDRLLATRALTLGPLGGIIYGNVSVFGPIAGPGYLKINGGTVTLRNDTTLGQNPNNYAGGTRVLYAGSLIVSNNVSLGSGDLMLEPGASATLWGNTNLASAAKADVAFGTTLYLTGFAPTFGNILGGGNVVLGNGTAPKNDTTLTIGGDNSTSTFNGLISQVSATAGQGKGSLVKTGTGTLTISGTHTYTGPTMVSNGTLRLIGSLAGNLTVSSGATLAGYGAVGGSLTNNGTFLMNLTSASVYDSISVTGNVNVAGATLVLTGNFRPLSNQPLTLIQGGSITGTFASAPTGFFIKNSGGSLVLHRSAGSAAFFR